MVGEALGPAEKEIGNDGDGRGRMGTEPLNNGVVELAEGSHDGEISMVADVADVFGANGEFGVRREGKNEGLNGWVGLKKGVKEGEDFGGNQDGNCEAPMRG